MKIIAYILLLFFIVHNTKGQQYSLDSLQKQFKKAGNDTSKVKILMTMGDYYLFTRQDSAIYYYSRAIELSEEISYTPGSFTGYLQLATTLNLESNYSKALEMAVKSLKIAEQLKENKLTSMADAYCAMGRLNLRMKNDSAALQQCYRSIALYKKSKEPIKQWEWGAFVNVALVYLKQNKLDSALYYAQASYESALHLQATNQPYLSVAISTLANVYQRKKNYVLAHNWFYQGLQALKKYPPSPLTVFFYNEYARFFQRTGELDSCIAYANTGLQLSKNKSFGEHAPNAASILTEAYESQHQPDSALKYLKIMTALKDSIFSQTKLQNFQLLNFEEGQRQKDIEIAKERYQERLRFYALISAMLMFLVLVVILYRNNRNKQKANLLLQNEKQKVESTLSELKSTQAQLIQSEKMASLGELTAGIAHEIQNPLNFVNNFSDVNKELVDEAKQEIKNGNITDVDAILNDIKANEEKINHHGKRADSIVKGMLQHSRSSSGLKESTDINALADEYLRLAYHGLRAKDKSFNATTKTEFDNSIGKINVNPQDIGRVILNLINNAFYAVTEKAKQNISGYEPTVIVTSKRGGADKVELRVTDNGNGIPSKIVDKIFQPFFTTKPTGQGTGLGLSLAYDIITSHGGEIKVETKQNEGSNFVISLPIK